jgi:mRNA interferase RelE/StbE
MAHAIHWTTSAERDAKGLKNLRESDRAAIREAIAAIAEEPRGHGCEKLKGDQGYRVRAGNYRIIYDIDDAEPGVTILAIGDRRDVYR